MKSLASRRAMSIILISAFAFSFLPKQAQAQNTEERFQDLFKTAGYATLFGAGLGAACLAFTERPSSKLRYVAVGASLGFIGGSVFGSYLIFSPMFVENDPNLGENPDYIAQHNSKAKFNIHPVFSSDGLKGVGGSLTLAKF